MAVYRPPVAPYLGPPAKHSGQKNKPITRVVLHGTVSPCERGGARKTAAYFRSKSAGGSAHYIVDPGEIVQSAYDSWVAWHAPPNPHSIGIELCDWVGKNGKALPMSRWDDANHRSMLQLAARLTAELCLAYKVPTAMVGAATLKSGRGGVTEHSDVSEAFKQSSHWDLGEFPRSRFQRMVENEVRFINAGSPTGKPITAKTCCPANAQLPVPVWKAPAKGAPVTPPPAAKKPAPASFLLRIQHSSMQRTDPRSQQAADLAKIFATGNHVITFTEVGVGENPTGRDLVKAAAAKAGYTLHLDRFNCGVALKLPGATVVDKGYEGPIIPGKSGSNPHLGLCWLTFTHPKLGTVTIGASHWLAQDNVVARAKANDRMSAHIDRFLRDKAAGAKIAFVTGDTNRDDARGNSMPKGWTTIWDELRKWPDTHGNRTIDIIASYDLDGRVTARSGAALPLKLYSDHRTVQAVYAVKPVGT